MLRDRETAEEVVQDAFLSVWRQAQTYNPGVGRVKPWLMSIVHHRAIDRIRRTQGKAAPVYLEEAWMMADPSDPASEALRNLDRDQIRGFVQALPPDQRHAIELSYFRGHTFVEVARITGVPVGTVKSRVRLGLGKLRDSMAGWHDAGLAIA
jgi:RNA polymerase sigma-70 factor (ECF subfamily)